MGIDMAIRAGKTAKLMPPMRVASREEWRLRFAPRGHRGPVMLPGRTVPTVECRWVTDVNKRLVPVRTPSGRIRINPRLGFEVTREGRALRENGRLIPVRITSRPAAKKVAT